MNEQNQNSGEHDGSGEMEKEVLQSQLAQIGKDVENLEFRLKQIDVDISSLMPAVKTGFVRQSLEELLEEKRLLSNSLYEAQMKQKEIAKQIGVSK